MHARQIVLDTETTGLRTEDGHRIIEVAAVELLNRRFTGNVLHYYLNPGRAIDAGAQAVHGLTEAFLSDKPAFATQAGQLLDFITGAELIIHNASFDLNFLNYEYSLIDASFKSIEHHCPILDTLKLARARHMGQRNNLDALCKRYSIDNSKRELHGALLDAHLLAQVYLAMTGGQGSFFDNPLEHSDNQQKKSRQANVPKLAKVTPLIHATAEELAAHEQMLTDIAKESTCLWQVKLDG